MSDLSETQIRDGKERSLGDKHYDDSPRDFDSAISSNTDTNGTTTYTVVETSDERFEFLSVVLTQPSTVRIEAMINAQISVAPNGVKNGVFAIFVDDVIQLPAANTYSGVGGDIAKETLPILLVLDLDVGSHKIDLRFKKVGGATYDIVFLSGILFYTILASK